MRPTVRLAVLTSLVLAVACLSVGIGGNASCSPGMANVACLGPWAASTHELLGVVGVAFLIVIGFFVASTVWQARLHRRLAGALEHAALPVRMADHEVGLVEGLEHPCVAGLGRPQIYCPPDLGRRLTEGELRAVILHERHHQLDHAPARLVLLAAIATAFRHLTIGRRWLEHRRALIEIAADDHALGAGVGRADLARALLKLDGAPALGGLPGYGSASDVRLRHLLGDTTPASQPITSPMVLLLLPLAAFVACVAWALIA